MDNNLLKQIEQNVENIQTALQQIGYLVTKEINTNRKFRRQLEDTNLGKQILFIMQQSNSK